MEALNFQLEQFEGPLDLLLHLVSKNKMNIYEINILALIDQYLLFVQTAHDYELESASEFIEMAARLVQMKSYFLLPKSEEAERMRSELTGMLVEYSLCKVIASKLRTMADGVFTVVREPAEVAPDNTYQLLHDVSLLEAAYNTLQGRSLRKRQPEPERFETIVQAPFVSVSSRILFVLRGLLQGKMQCLQQMFRPGGPRSQTVATFLALLELMRAGRVTITENETLHVSKRDRRGARPEPILNAGE